MKDQHFPIVGMFYRKPAQAIIDCIPIGTHIYAYAEPSNEVDPNAIAILIDSEHIPEQCHDSLDIKLANYGMEIGDIMGEPTWHLGYIPKGLAAMLKNSGDVQDNIIYHGTFMQDMKGKPMINFNGDENG